MYEVRWSLISGAPDCMKSFDEEIDAWKRFYELTETDGISSVGIYGIDGDGAEMELAVWCR